MNLMKRRRDIMKCDDYLAGWQMNKGLSSTGTEITQVGNLLSPYFTIIANNYFSVKVWQTKPAKVVNGTETFDEQGNVIDRRNTDHVNTNYTLKGNSIRIVCKADDIDYCYIYDRSAARYIWAGKNVDTIAPP